MPLQNFKIKNIMKNDISILIPVYNSEKYLESLYGDNWKTPDDFWTNRYKEKI